jgi:hypothetical protein
LPLERGIADIFAVTVYTEIDGGKEMPVSNSPASRPGIPYPRFFDFIAFKNSAHFNVIVYLLLLFITL